VKSKKIKAAIKVINKDTFVVKIDGRLPSCLNAQEFQAIKDAFKNWIAIEAYPSQNFN
jgi:hypothetical protein